MQYKLRMLVPQKECVGITIPREVAQFFSGCYFKIEVTKINNKYGFFCQSGCVVVPDKKELEKTEWSEV